MGDPLFFTFCQKKHTDVTCMKVTFANFAK